MRIVITPTEHVRRVNGQLCRVWAGATNKGVGVRVFVAALAADETCDLRDIEEALGEMVPPCITMEDGGEDNGEWR